MAAERLARPALEMAVPVVIIGAVLDDMQWEPARRRCEASRLVLPIGGEAERRGEVAGLGACQCLALLEASCARRRIALGACRRE